MYKSFLARLTGTSAHYSAFVFEMDAAGRAAMDEFKSAVVKLADETKAVQKIKTEIEGRMAAGENVTAEVKQAADKALADTVTQNVRVTELEQKMSRAMGAGGAVEHKSTGREMIDSDEFKQYAARGGKHGSARIEVKTISPITSQSTTGTSVTTGLVTADRQGMIQMQPNRPLVIRDLIAGGQTSSSAIEWPRETVFTNNAASVAENPANPKPQSDLRFDIVHTPVATIAHFIMASRQILADAPMLMSYIDNRLTYGLEYEVDRELLLGDGVGTNLLGIIPQATPYAAPTGVTVQGETSIDRLRLAMLQSTVGLFPATAHVLHPVDWAAIELTKDTQNRYLMANPAGTLQPTLWGLPVATTLAMPIGTFLTGALRYACQVFDREAASVMVSSEDRDNFVRNMVTILAELRLALAVYRPQALITGSLPTAAH